MEVGVPELLTFAARAEREARALMGARTVDAVTGATDAGAELTRAWAPVVTGWLQRSITTRVVGTGRVVGSVRGTIRANVPHSSSAHKQAFR